MTLDHSNILLPEPLAYFLTWPTYGSWLPGDQRGWVKYHRGFQAPDSAKERATRACMSEKACRFSKDERLTVEATVVEHCRIRNWSLHAVNCRSNHLHVVLTASEHPDEVRDQLKAWTSRKLKEFQRRTIAAGTPETTPPRARWWAERGSKRYINDQESLEAAILYVRDSQDEWGDHR